MRILVVGSGGREHALCWALRRSPQCGALFCAPGNGGIAAHAECVAIDADDVAALVAFARVQQIDLVIPGPEVPLVNGLVDRLEAIGIAACGPRAAAAALEGSKSFMKALCRRHGIPTAGWSRFGAGEVEAARAYARAHGAPIVVKADGLAAGKGVTVAATVDEALAAIDDCLVDGRFGDAGCEVVIEDCLVGEEVSFFALVDGTTVLPLTSAQDHKRAFDGDTGPNTGGMGAYSPAPALTPALTERVMAEIIRPTVVAMAGEGCPFRGVLFAGLMIVDGAAGPEPYLLEYNVRFGDPECQVLLPRLESDLLPLLHAAAVGRLEGCTVSWRPDAALCVVMAAGGYPGAYTKGSRIAGLAAASAIDGVTLFHAATKRDEDGAWRAEGGRVLGVAARGGTVAEARTRAYRAVDTIVWPEGFCRRDIGWRALAREAACPPSPLE